MRKPELGTRKGGHRAARRFLLCVGGSCVGGVNAEVGTLLNAEAGTRNAENGASAATTFLVLRGCSCVGRLKDGSRTLLNADAGTRNAERRELCGEAFPVVRGRLVRGRSECGSRKAERERRNRAARRFLVVRGRPHLSQVVAAFETLSA